MRDGVHRAKAAEQPLLMAALSEPSWGCPGHPALRLLTQTAPLCSPCVPTPWEKWSDVERGERVGVFLRNQGAGSLPGARKEFLGLSLTKFWSRNVYGCKHPQGLEGKVIGPLAWRVRSHVQVM